MKIDTTTYKLNVKMAFHILHENMRVVWQRHCLSGIETVTKEGSSLQMVNWLLLFLSIQVCTDNSHRMCSERLNILAFDWLPLCFQHLAP